MTRRVASTVVVMAGVASLAAGCGSEASGPSERAAGPSARAAATSEAPQICGPAKAKPSQVRLRSASQEPLKPMQGVQGEDVTPDKLRKSATTPGRRGMELTARDFLAAIENPKHFSDSADLKKYLAPGINAEGKRLVDERITVTTKLSPGRWNFQRKVIYQSELDVDGVGWFEQVGWLEAVKPGWEGAKLWQGRRAMLVWSGDGWRVACLSDVLPATHSLDADDTPSYVRSLDWQRYKP